ncbi:MAG: peptidoglycan DD-metalloendopeptidase family protein [Rubrivivax sp.]
MNPNLTSTGVAPARARRWRSLTSWLVPAALALLLTACGSTRYRAPVEDRGGTPVPAPVASAPLPTTTTTPAPIAALPVTPAEVNGRPLYVVVKPGDTLIRLGLETGQNWRDLARWNNLENPNVLEVGQSLRALPPGIEFSQAGARPVAAAGPIETRPLEAARPGVAAIAAIAAAAPAASSPIVPSTPAPSKDVAKDPDEDLGWVWPAAGTVLATFDDARNKGLAIGGRAGDPVLAAAEGRVVYAGSGLRGYGNLVIIKHNNTFLSAYAHNQTLLVKEDQTVRRGQKIAEMGSSDADRVKLHFEIRRQGKPVDPARFLPAR